MLFYLEKYAYRTGLSQHALLENLPKLEMNKLTDKCRRRIQMIGIKVTSCLFYIEKQGDSSDTDYTDDVHTHTSWPKSLETI